MPMKINTKYLLASELGLSFGAVVIFWFLGLIILPGMLVETISGAENYKSFLSTMVLGALGLAGLYQLVKIVLFESESAVSLPVIGALVFSGIVGLFLGFGANNMKLSVKIMLVILPIGCSIHFLYLACQHLTSKGKPTRKTRARLL